MAGFDSHIPDSVEPVSVSGLGLNDEELARNERLTDRVLHDLNADRRLPFEDETFDVVLNTVSVDYMTKPFEVFTEVARVLKPGGLFLVIFSNRMFTAKAVKIWRESSEVERQIFVEELFTALPQFNPATTFISRGKPRPNDDKYAGFGLPSDPITAVYAEKAGNGLHRARRPSIQPDLEGMPSREDVMRRKATVSETLECPYCEDKLVKWEIPDSPFNEWPNDYMYICFNNDCPYLVSGWDVLTGLGSPGFSYRLMYNPAQNRCQPVPVTSPRADHEQHYRPRG